MITLNYKLLNTNSKPPVKGSQGAACYDLFMSDAKSLDAGLVEYNTGIAVQIPEGYVGLLFPRSSISNTRQWMANSVGVIDSDYTGPVKIRCYFDPDDTRREYYKAGDRCGQLMVVPVEQAELKQVKEIKETKRGGGSFGSTGR